MNHSLKISLNPKQPTAGTVCVKNVSLREKILCRLFGTPQKMTVIVPGDTVDEISICEIPGGAECEAI